MGGTIMLSIHDRSGGVIVPRFQAIPWSGFMLHAMAVGPGGHVALAWGSYEQLFIVTYDRSGTMTSIAAVFQLHSAPPRILKVALDVDAAGGVVVAWQVNDASQPVDRSSVLYRRFSPSGEALHPPAPVQPPSRRLGLGSVALNAADGFLVSWHVNDWSSLPDRLFVRAFGADGTALTDPIELMSTDDDISAHDMAVGPAGYISLVWGEYENARNRLYTRSFSGNGVPQSEPTQLGDPARDSAHGRIGVGAYGDVFVSWTDFDLGASPIGGHLYGQRFSPPGVSIRKVGPTPIWNLVAQKGEWLYFRFDVPAGHDTLNASISGGTGDADLYLRYGTLPRLDAWDARPYRWGNQENVAARGNVAGTWFIGLHAYQSFDGLGLRVSSQ